MFDSRVRVRVVVRLGVRVRTTLRITGSKSAPQFALLLHLDLPALRALILG